MIARLRNKVTATAQLNNKVSSVAKLRNKVSVIAQICCPYSVILRLSFYVSAGDGALEGAAVTIGTETKLTDETGGVDFFLEPGTYEYAISKLGYTTVVDTVELTNANVTLMIDLPLATTDVTFKVYDDLGAVKSGALVTVGDSSQFTDANGETVFSLMVGDSFNYSVSATNFLTSTGTFVASVGLTVTVNLLWSFDAETTDWESRVIANSGTISYTTKKNEDLWLKEEKITGRRSMHVRVNHFLGDQIAAAVVPLIRSKTPLGVVGNAIDVRAGVSLLSAYSESAGITGNGSGYLNTGLTPSTTSEMTNNIGCVVINNTNINSGALIGTVGGGVQNCRVQTNATNLTYAENDNTTSIMFSGAAIEPYTYLGYRSGNTKKMSRDAGTYTSVTVTNLGKASQPIYVFGLNNNGTLAAASSNRLSGYHILDSVGSDADGVAILNNLNSLMAKYGRNTY